MLDITILLSLESVTPDPLHSTVTATGVSTASFKSVLQTRTALLPVMRAVLGGSMMITRGVGTGNGRKG